MKLSGKVEGQFVCAYFLAPETDNITERLNAKTAQVEAQPEQTGIIQLGWTDVHWALLKFKGLMPDSYLAIADLPDGRSVELFIDLEADPKRALTLLTDVCSQMKYEPDNLIENGRTFVKQLRDTGTQKLIETDTSGSFKRVFLLKKSKNSTETEDFGFSIEAFNKSQRYQQNGSIGGESFFHSTIKRELNNNIQFEINRAADQFVWQSRFLGQGGKGDENAQIELDENGEMRIISLLSANERTCRPSDIAIPEMMVDSAIKAFVDQSPQPLMIDIIFGKGWIMPAKLEMMKIDDLDRWPYSKASYGVIMEYIHNFPTRHYIFFDADKKVLGKIDPSSNEDNRIVWHRIEGTELLSKPLFQPWYDDIARLLETVEGI